MFEVINDSGNKQKILQERLQEYKDNALLTETEEKSAIIFTPHVNGGRGCYPLSNYLNAIYPQKCNWFSGQAPKTDEVDANGNRTGKKIPIMDEETFKKHKEDVQIGFKSNKYPLLTATKAFGMGIDKDNIYYTIHYGIPSSVEALYQEAGRAGRWDKNKEENKDKKGNCIVLYSPESVNKERVDRIFQLETTFAEIEQINKEVGRRGQDVFSQVFLFVQNHKDIEEEAVIIRRIVDKYYQQNSKKKIYWNEVRREFNISEDILEKVIYRLSLLGIVSDWTTDFINYYEVEFDSCDENHIIKHISNYITKYQANANVAQNVEEIKKDTFLEKVIHYLLQWIFEHIVYNRKQSLKTLVEWCDKFEEEGNEAFKRRIDNYFKFTDATFIFQHILENPNDYKKWFEVFIHKELNDQNEVINTIYMPTILNEEERFHEFERLRDSLSRFLESSGVDNTGLNFVSGLIRLFLNQYKDSDGIERFEKSLKDIKQTFDKVIQLHIMDELKKLGDNMIENSRYDLSLSILKFYPEYIEELADRYKLPYLLTDFYIEQITKIKTLNNRIDEQLTEI
jgi:ATP-dependent DNA helicase RecQ